MMSFLSPLALLAGLLAIPVILLYMLRLRRRETSVSSTYLWQQVVRDREANTPWQKLRRNLLLLLQLLLLALLVIALARPFITVPAVTSGQIALLLDASASMNATDVDNGTRFAAAQRIANDIVDTMNAGDRMTVIRVADVPEVLAGYTNDSAVLHTAIDSAQASSALADWTAALTLAAAGGASAQDFNVLIIGDGGIGSAAEFPPIPGDIEFVPVGRSDANLAVTALAARGLPGQNPQLFAEITNYSAVDADVIFSLGVDGALFSAERYTVPARGKLPVVSSALPEDYSTLQAALTPPSGSTFVDYLPQDDAAFAVAPGAGMRNVLLMSSGNRFVEQVLRSMPGVRIFQGSTDIGMPTGDFDLVVLDGWLPNTLPQDDLLIINPPSSNALFTLGDYTDQTSGIHVRRDDPRMTFVDFDAVNVLRFRQVEADWAEPLISAEGGALLLAGEVDGRQIAILPFDLHETDLPLQITFPILMTALLDWYTPEDVLARNAFVVGEPVGLRLPADAQAASVTLPDGAQRELPMQANPVFGDTEQPGLYALDLTHQNDTVERTYFSVNLFAPLESEIAPRTTLTLGQIEVASGEEEEIGQYEFWGWLALLGLVILLIEWFVYWRRTRAPVAFRPLDLRGARQKQPGR
ncbi:MAG: VWA domain-containing protein [Anaerolineae bacterium]|nr:VWA domain-containing protein [Anaerolineae bacterium]